MKKCYKQFSVFTESSLFWGVHNITFKQTHPDFAKHSPDFRHLVCSDFKLPEIKYHLNNLGYLKK